MPEFQYQGVDREGKKVVGRLEAPGEGELRVLLRNQGIRPIRIAKSNLLQADLGTMLKGGSSTLSTEALVTFTRQLHVLIGSGVPLVQSLDILGGQAPDATLKKILALVKDKVAQGSFFWESLSMYPKAFPKIYLALVRAGESSGSLEIMLKRLSRYLEDAYRLAKMVRSAMIYPIVVVSIGIAVVAVMLTMVIPKFEELLKTSGQELPGPTQFVIDLSHFMVNNILYIIVGLVLGITLTRKYIKSPEGKAMLDRVLYRAPLFGGIMQKSGIARFSRTMATLLGSGVNLIDAIDICKSTIDNAVLETAISRIRGEVESGKTLGGVISKLGVFPIMAVQMISVGESTGNLDQMLEKVASFYEDEVETLVGGLTKLIEPLVLVFLGGTVGGLMIAMYLPIFKLAGAQQ